MIGPSLAWALGMQRQGREEMTTRLREEGPAAAADFAVGFEKYANEWLVWNGFAAGFVFEPIPLPATPLAKPP
jgi:hypothetical protein